MTIDLQQNEVVYVHIFNSIRGKKIKTFLFYNWYVNAEKDLFTIEYFDQQISESALTVYDSIWTGLRLN